MTVSGHHDEPGWISLGQGCIEGICKLKPSLLSNDWNGVHVKRIRESIGVLVSLSGSEVLGNRDSPQYRAACW
eukprot:14132677-Ditylum_brightwellii.AAC.1